MGFFIYKLKNGLELSKYRDYAYRIDTIIKIFSFTELHFDSGRKATVSAMYNPIKLKEPLSLKIGDVVSIYCIYAQRFKDYLIDGILFDANNGLSYSEYEIMIDKWKIKELTDYRNSLK
jgi:hypothetical protein